MFMHLLVDMISIFICDIERTAVKTVITEEIIEAY